MISSQYFLLLRICSLVFLYVLYILKPYFVNFYKWQSFNFWICWLLGERTKLHPYFCLNFKKHSFRYIRLSKLASHDDSFLATFPWSGFKLCWCLFVLPFLSSLFWKILRKWIFLSNCQEIFRIFYAILYRRSLKITI